jgi:membrane-bound metal-dependent hydrolase YbcI (DUF457 family)
MMAKTHALSGLAAGLITLPTVVAVLHPGPVGCALYLAVTTGAALLPDFDHPDATAAHTFGVFTRVFAWAVAWLTEGHRHGSHSYNGAAAVTLITSAGAALYGHDVQMFAYGVVAAAVLAAAGMAGGGADRARGRAQIPRPREAGAKRRRQAAVTARAAAWAGIAVTLAWSAHSRPGLTGLVIVGGVLVLTLASAIHPLKIRGRLDDIAPIPITALILWLHIDVTVVPCAVTVGVITHILGDQMTHGGCPVYWPLSHRDVHITLPGGTFATGSDTEFGPVTRVLWAVVIFAVVVEVGQGVGMGHGVAAWHHLQSAWTAS